MPEAEAALIARETALAAMMVLISAPMTYLGDGGRLVVFAANGGRPAHPAWYRNLAAEPAVHVEVGVGEPIPILRFRVQHRQAVLAGGNSGAT